eukprot:jgi/Chrzof1/8168/Cz03g00080.t1
MWRSMPAAVGVQSTQISSNLVDSCTSSMPSAIIMQHTRSAHQKGRWHLNQGSKQKAATLTADISKAPSLDSLQQLVQSHVGHINGIHVSAAAKRALTLCKTSHNYLQHQQQVPSIMNILGVELGKCLAESAPHHLATYLHSCAKSRCMPPAELLSQFFTHLVADDGKALRSSNSFVVAQLCSSIAALKVPDTRLWEVLGDRAVAVRADLTPANCANIMAALAKVGYTNNTPLWQALAETARQHVAVMSSHDLAVILFAQAQAKQVDMQLIQAAEEYGAAGCRHVAVKPAALPAVPEPAANSTSIAAAAKARLRARKQHAQQQQQQQLSAPAAGLNDSSSGLSVQHILDSMTHDDSSKQQVSRAQGLNRWHQHHLVLMAWAMAHAGRTTSCYLHHLAQELCRDASQLGPRDLTLAIQAFGKAAQQHEGVVHKLVDQALQIMHQLRPHELVSLLQCCSEAGLTHDDLYAQTTGRLRQLAGQLSGVLLVQGLQALDSMNQKHQVVQLLQAAQQQLKDGLMHMPTDRLVMLAQIVCRADMPQVSLFKAVASAGSARLDQLQPAEVVQLAEALAQHNTKLQSGFFDGMLLQTLERYNNFSQEQLQALSSVYDRLHHPEAKMLQFLGQGLDVLVQHTMRRVGSSLASSSSSSSSSTTSRPDSSVTISTECTSWWQQLLQEYEQLHVVNSRTSSHALATMAAAAAVLDPATITPGLDIAGLRQAIASDVHSTQLMHWQQHELLLLLWAMSKTDSLKDQAIWECTTSRLVQLCDSAWCADDVASLSWCLATHTPVAPATQAAAAHEQQLWGLVHNQVPRLLSDELRGEGKHHSTQVCNSGGASISRCRIPAASACILLWSLAKANISTEATMIQQLCDIALDKTAKLAADRLAAVAWAIGKLCSTTASPDPVSSTASTAMQRRTVMNKVQSQLTDRIQKTLQHRQLGFSVNDLIVLLWAAPHVLPRTSGVLDQLVLQLSFHADDMTNDMLAQTMLGLAAIRQQKQAPGPSGVSTHQQTPQMAHGFRALAKVAVLRISQFDAQQLLLMAAVFTHVNHKHAALADAIAIAAAEGLTAGTLHFQPPQWQWLQQALVGLGASLQQQQKLADIMPYDTQQPAGHQSSDNMAYDGSMKVTEYAASCTPIIQRHDDSVGCSHGGVDQPHDQTWEAPSSTELPHHAPSATHGLHDYDMLQGLMTAVPVRSAGWNGMSCQLVVPLQPQLQPPTFTVALDRQMLHALIAMRRQKAVHAAAMIM